MKTLQGDGFTVAHDDDAGLVRVSGVLRLGGMSEYLPITELLENALNGSASLTLDLTGLTFLNSSGIATLSKFVITARNHGGCQLTIRGGTTVPWQTKSLNNLRRLMPSLSLEFDQAREGE